CKLVVVFFQITLFARQMDETLVLLFVSLPDGLVSRYVEILDLTNHHELLPVDIDLVHPPASTNRALIPSENIFQ
ncbi:MAG TPA: hypothetical protein PKG49_09285, partial [Nitrosomonas mobilis]|nr:hypothetical protein [Nitrosomonas mobilis]